MNDKVPMTKAGMVKEFGDANTAMWLQSGKLPKLPEPVTSVIAEDDEVAFFEVAKTLKADFALRLD